MAYGCDKLWKQVPTYVGCTQLMNTSETLYVWFVLVWPFVGLISGVRLLKIVIMNCLKLEYKKGRHKTNGMSFQNPSSAFSEADLSGWWVRNQQINQGRIRDLNPWVCWTWVFSVWWNYSQQHTPLKFNMEPKNQTLEKEIPFENHHFQVPCLTSGVYIIMMFIWVNILWDLLLIFPFSWFA